MNGVQQVDGHDRGGGNYHDGDGDGVITHDEAVGGDHNPVSCNVRSGPALLGGKKTAVRTAASAPAAIASTNRRVRPRMREDIGQTHAYRLAKMGRERTRGSLLIKRSLGDEHLMPRSV